jgi:hypothetical protein
MDCADHFDMASKFLDLGIAPVIIPLLRQHLLSAAATQWTASALVSLCSVNSKRPSTSSSSGSSGSGTAGQSLASSASTKRSSLLSSSTTTAVSSTAIAVSAGSSRSPQVLLGESSLHLFDHLAQALFQHRQSSPLPTVIALLKCLRALCVFCSENQLQVTRSGLLLPLSLQLLNIYVANDVVCEHAAWLLGNVEYRPVKPRGHAVLQDPAAFFNATSAATRSTDEDHGACLFVLFIL